MKRLTLSLVGGWIAVLSIGCGSSVETGVVTGVVTRGGEPLEGVLVYYMPDPEKATQGAHSTATTDDNGRYELTYYGEDRQPGAVVGWHRVTLEDTVPENFRGSGARPQSRVPKVMMKAWKTPLSFEVVAGEQEINIDVDAAMLGHRNLAKPK